MSFVANTRRVRRLVVLSLAIVGIAVGVAFPGGLRTEAAASTNPAVLSGAAKVAPSGASSFGTWRGRPAKVVTDYLGSATWASMSDAAWAPARWNGAPYHIVYSLPMLPAQGGATIQQGATGAYNKYFKQIAIDLVAGDRGYSTIRLGWEMNGNWYNWSADSDPTSWVAYWRQIVNTMRSVSGAHFKFDWTIANNDPHNPTPMYPGDAYVDYIGTDIYDQSWAVSYPASNHQKVWNGLSAAAPYGLNWVANFAATHHKPITLPEWGLVSRCDGHGGGDDPYFIQQMYNWITTHYVAYETYFNSDDSTCRKFTINGGSFPNAAALYKKLWASGTA